MVQQRVSQRIYPLTIKGLEEAMRLLWECRSLWLHCRSARDWRGSKKMVPLAGIGPATYPLGGDRSIH